LVEHSFENGKGTGTRLVIANLRRQPLRHDPLQPELAGMPEHCGAIFVDVLIKDDPIGLAAQKLRQPRLTLVDNFPAATRRDWAKKVMAQLAPKIAEHKRIVMFAG
jgi:hypothetical protein